jgi:large subunit ribosomal protein L1
MNKEQLENALKKAYEDKGKRKFPQSVELIVNFRWIDFSKPENRLNLDIVLPKGKGSKQPKVAIIADENTAATAKKASPELVISPNEIASYSDPAKLKMLAGEYVLLCQPNLMGQVAKSLGQYLGPRGKLPKPLVGNAADLVEKARKSVRIVSKGKYLPVAQALVGTEEMDVKDVLENVETVYDIIKAKVTEPNIRSMYVKMTMGKPVKIG